MQVSSVHCAEVNRPCNRERLLDTCTLRSLSVHDVFRSVHAHCYRVTHQSDGINERIICRQQYPDIICRQQYPHDYFTYILNRLGIRPWENRNTCQIFVHIVSGDPLFKFFIFESISMDIFLLKPWGVNPPLWSFVDTWPLSIAWKNPMMCNVIACDYHTWWDLSLFGCQSW